MNYYVEDENQENKIQENPVAEGQNSYEESENTESKEQPTEQITEDTPKSRTLLHRITQIGKKSFYEIFGGNFLTRKIVREWSPVFVCMVIFCIVGIFSVKRYERVCLELEKLNTQKERAESMYLQSCRELNEAQKQSVLTVKLKERGFIENNKRIDKIRVKK